MSVSPIATGHGEPTLTAARTAPRAGDIAWAATVIGIVVWRALASSSVGGFVGSLTLWLGTVALAYWVVAVWNVVFSLRGERAG